MVDQNEYLITLSETLCPLVWDAPLAALSAEEQVVVCVYELEREVNNGGFDQFFRNAPGRYARETVEALEAIGASAMADITRRATTLVFPEATLAEHQDARSERLDAAGESLQQALSELDERFCEYPDNLTEQLFRYVQANREAIRGATPA